MQSVVTQWYDKPLKKLLERKLNMPHALLISGPSGSGKGQFAGILVAALLCTNSKDDGLACGHCQNCHLLASGTHPDYYSITPSTNDDGKPAKDIKVEQIRQLIVSLGKTSGLQGKKIALIDPAEKMNRNAANSLLKTLEEPTADTLLILLSAQPSRLLPTIRSRCQHIALRIPPRNVVINWLQRECPGADVAALYAAANGAPFTALNLAEGDNLVTRATLFREFCAVAMGQMDPVSSAANWLGCEPELAFQWLSSWLHDLIRLTSKVDNPVLQNIDLEKSLHELANRIDLPSLFRFNDIVQRSMVMARGNANMQLLHESLQLEWSNQCAIKS